VGKAYFHVISALLRVYQNSRCWKFVEEHCRFDYFS